MRPLDRPLVTALAATAMLAAPAAGALAKQSLAAIYIALAVLLLLIAVVRDCAVPRPDLLAASLFGVLALWVAGSHLLLPVCDGCEGKALDKVAMLGLVLWAATAPLLDREASLARRVLDMAALGLVIGAALVLAELSTGSAVYRLFGGDDAVPYRYNRGITAMVLLAWPVAAGLVASGRARHAALVVGASLVVAGAGESTSAQVAALIGVAVFGLARFAPRAVAAVTVGAAAILGIAAPWLARSLGGRLEDVASRIPPSFGDRLEIWDHAARAVLTGHWWGHGIGAHRTLPFTEADAARYTVMTQSPTHPHDAPLQLWVELGWVGPLAWAAAMLLIWRGIAGLEARHQPFAVAALAAGLFIAAVSYGLWQATWLATIGMTLLMFRFAARA